jgi:hypothetical protein
MPERVRNKHVKTVKERNKEKGYDKVFDVARAVAGPGAGAGSAKALAYALKIAKLARGESAANKVINNRPNSDKTPSDRQPISHSVFDIDVASLIPKEMPRRRPFRTVDAPVRPQKPPPPQPPRPSEEQTAAAVIHHK